MNIPSLASMVIMRKPGVTISKGAPTAEPVMLCIAPGSTYTLIGLDGTTESPEYPDTSGGWIPVVCRGLGAASATASAVAHDIKYP